MLRSQDVIGVPVITDDTGEEVGSVKDVIVHRVKKSVLGFLVRRPGWFQHLSVLPFADVLSFGDLEITVETKNSLLSFSNAQDAVRHLERKPLPGTTLITTEGHEIGQIADFSFDEDTGDLSGFDVFIDSDDDEEPRPKFLPLDDGFFIGKYDVIVSERAVHHTMPETKEFACVDSPTANTKIELHPKPVIQESTETPFPKSVVIPPPPSPPAPAAPQPSEPFRITSDSNSLTVTFDSLAGLDELCIARLRTQLLRMLADNKSYTILRFDITHLKMLPSVMLGLLASFRQQVSTLEVLNPSKDAHDMLRMMGFDKLFKIRNQST